MLLGCIADCDPNKFSEGRGLGWPGAWGLGVVGVPAPLGTPVAFSQGTFDPINGLIPSHSIRNRNMSPTCSGVVVARFSVLFPLLRGLVMIAVVIRYDPPLTPYEVTAADRRFRRR